MNISYKDLILTEYEKIITLHTKTPHYNKYHQALKAV
ncbi:hypothetical protein EV693_102121 [Nicoletella semolina]|uniref:Uncharacterized protein n=1 Tax=Nicoletella semolina TaxID=271160 RepID=A0A4R2NBS9_9PAST|nr:hypothetical protein EV693_102121 [Nicoletella semolina]